MKAISLYILILASLIYSNVYSQSFDAFSEEIRDTDIYKVEGAWIIKEDNDIQKYVPTTKRGLPPTWNKYDISSTLARRIIVKDAANIVYQKLAQCGSNSNIVKYYQARDLGDKGRPLFHKMFSQESKSYSGEKTRLIPKYLTRGNLINNRSTVKIFPKYNNVNRHFKYGARVHSKITQRLLPFKIKTYRDEFGQTWSTYCCGNKNAREKINKNGKSVYYWDAVGIKFPISKNNTYNRNYSYGSNTKCYREELQIIIEIFPEVFLRKSLWIKSEKRWARDALEACIYLILHELGHVERYIEKNSLHYEMGVNHFPYTIQENDEDAIWEYASSIMRCDR